MDWEAIGAIAEVLGAIAVVATLGYPAIQIRQNTKAVRIQTYQAVMDSSNHLGDSPAEQNIDAIYRKGRKEPGNCSAEEWSQFVLIAGQVMNLYEGLYLHHQSGAIDDDFFVNRWKTFHHIMHQPGFRLMWTEKMGAYYSISFTSAVDGLVGEKPGQ